MDRGGETTDDPADVSDEPDGQPSNSGRSPPLRSWKPDVSVRRERRSFSWLGSLMGTLLKWIVARPADETDAGSPACYSILMPCSSNHLDNPASGPLLIDMK